MAMLRSAGVSRSLIIFNAILVTTAMTVPASGAIETVIVTAEKKAEDIQTVPIAVSAFLAKDREKIGIKTIQDLASFTPGMTYSTSTDRVSIRGISRQTNVLSADSGVANYSDGIYQSFAVEAGRSTLDVSRIEILRGPQGTLYGRNSIGGVINIISPRPTDEFYAEFRADYGSYDHSLIEGAVSGPINDDWGYRFYANWENQGLGYSKNIIPGAPEEGQVLDTWYVSGQLQGKIGKDLEVWAKVYSTAWNNGGGGPGSASGGWTPADYPTFELAQGGLGLNAGYGCSVNGGLYSTADTTVAPGSALSPIGAAACTNPSVRDPWHMAHLVPTTVTVPGAYYGTLQVTWHTGADFDAKFINGEEWYRYVLIGPSMTNSSGSQYEAPISQYTIPVESAGFGPCGVPFGDCPALTIHPQEYFNYQQQEFFTQNEVDFISTADSPLTWNTGLYSFYQHESQPVSAGDAQQAQYGTPFNAVPEGPFTLPHAPVGNRYFDDRPHFNDLSLAAYGQASYKILPEINLTAGVRYSYDHKWGEEMSRLEFFPVAPEFFGDSNVLTGTSPGGAYDLTPPGAFPLGSCQVDYGPPTCPGVAHEPGVTSATTYNPATGFADRHYGKSSAAWTGVARVEYTPDEGTLVYASYSRGYKGAGFNSGIFTFIIPKPFVGPEHVNAVEVGAKETFGDWLVLDTAAYYYGYEDMQVPLTVAATPGGLNQLEFLSIPHAISQGFEAEAFLTLFDHLNGTLSYSYDDAHISSALSPQLPGLLGVSDPQDPNGNVPGALPLFTPAQCLAAYNVATGVGPCGVDIYTIGPVGAAAPPTALNTCTNAAGCGWVIPQSLKGNRLPNSPVHKFAINLNYDWIIPNIGTLEPSLTYRFQGSQFGSIFSRFYNKSPSWDQWDFQVGFTSPDEHWVLYIYGKNLFNRIGYAQGATAARYAGTIDQNCDGTPNFGGLNVCNFVQGASLGAATATPPGYGRVRGESAYGTVSNYDITPPTLYGIQLQFKI